MKGRVALPVGRPTSRLGEAPLLAALREGLAREAASQQVEGRQARPVYVNHVAGELGLAKVERVPEKSARRRRFTGRAGAWGIRGEVAKSKALAVRTSPAPAG